MRQSFFALIMLRCVWHKADIRCVAIVCPLMPKRTTSLASRLGQRRCPMRPDFSSEQNAL